MLPPCATKTAYPAAPATVDSDDRSIEPPLASNSSASSRCTGTVSVVRFGSRTAPPLAAVTKCVLAPMLPSSNASLNERTAGASMTAPAPAA